jgi:predicted HTH transcriptional regulator
MMRVAFMTKAPVELALVKEKQIFKTHLRPINSNPANNSYIVVGVEDQDNEIVGVDFF